jgi:hypothetical protein
MIMGQHKSDLAGQHVGEPAKAKQLPTLYFGAET